MKVKKSTKRTGFTLVELAVVIVIIGVLAAFAVPRFRSAVERSKASEAFTYLSSFRAAQEVYHARMAEYADANAVTAGVLDFEMAAPKYFSVGTVTNTDTEADWELILTRSGATSTYGNYTVIFDESGYDVSSGINAFPEINPMAISS